MFRSISLLTSTPFPQLCYDLDEFQVCVVIAHSDLCIDINGVQFETLSNCLYSGYFHASATRFQKASWFTFVPRYGNQDELIYIQTSDCHCKVKFIKEFVYLFWNNRFLPFQCLLYFRTNSVAQKGQICWYSCQLTYRHCLPTLSQYCWTPPSSHQQRQPAETLVFPVTCYSSSYVFVFVTMLLFFFLFDFF